MHGGYWRSLDKQHFSFVARGLQPAGVLVAVINYALIPTVDMDELVRQVRASVAWLHRNVAALGGDPDNITVSGHSAGGHLTAMLLSTDWPAFAGLPADLVKAGCGISGLYDLEPIRLSVPERNPRAHDGDGEAEQPGPPGPGVRRPAPPPPLARSRATSTTGRRIPSPPPGDDAAFTSR